jgi:hypothetical protein
MGTWMRLAVIGLTLAVVVMTWNLLTYFRVVN